MAEYIKLDAIMEYCQNQKDKTINCNDLARFPTADVIERSKIDKAIEEMDSIDLNEYADNTYQLVNECIEILKRNIGE